MNTIAVAMSGGVDSSTAAAILKDQGHDVFGVFFVLSEAQDPTDAKKVAKQLGIKLHILDFSELFEQEILSDFVKTYEKGQTPNPCVRCNKLIKFGAVLEKVQELGADSLATGHYARLEKDQSGIFHLYNSADPNKDQTYFLHGLTQDQLAKVIFPLSDYTKPQVRKMAEKFGLPVAKKKESTDACFMINKNLNDFLDQKIKAKPGKICDWQSKQELGQHQGLHNYTIGQRKGIGLPGGPWFVYGLNVKQNILWVTCDQALLGQEKMKVINVNWIAGQEPKLPLKAECKIRYLSKPASVVISRCQNDYLVEFNQPQRAITPGQAAVFYQNQECLGGGTIAI